MFCMTNNNHCVYTVTGWMIMRIAHHCCWRPWDQISRAAKMRGAGKKNVLVPAFRLKSSKLFEISAVVGSLQTWSWVSFHPLSLQDSIPRCSVLRSCRLREAAAVSRRARRRCWPVGSHPTDDGSWEGQSRRSRCEDVQIGPCGSTWSCFRVVSITSSSSPASCSVPELLLTSASTSQTDKDGNTALHLACSTVSATLCLMSHSCRFQCRFTTKLIWDIRDIDAHREVGRKTAHIFIFRRHQQNTKFCIQVSKYPQTQSSLFELYSF